MGAGRMSWTSEEIVRESIGAVVNFDGEAYLDEIADHIREQLGEDAVDELLAKTGKATVEEVILMYLDERTGTKP
jgi:hypothetical protein